MIKWQDIDTVLLDMDGTLLDLAFDNYFWQVYVPQQYALQKQLTDSEASARLADWIARHQGTLNWYCLDFWSDELGLNIAALKRQVAQRIGYRQGAEDFLASLRASGRTVIMVTNAHPDALALKVERTGIDRYFDALVSSHQYRAAKEEQAFWETLRQHHPFATPRALLVDDSLPVLASAQQYGIGHLWSILHPDSSTSARTHTDPFPAIGDFAHVMPAGAP
ncbi:MAG: GMP/IMP nucleotidase [Alcanivorax sp.]|nr:GMP/IMP nucleotidase [Alcanivorax sp.]